MLRGDIRNAPALDLHRMSHRPYPGADLLLYQDVKQIVRFSNNIIRKSRPFTTKSSPTPSVVSPTTPPSPLTISSTPNKPKKHEKTHEYGKTSEQRPCRVYRRQARYGRQLELYGLSPLRIPRKGQILGSLPCPFPCCQIRELPV